MENDLVHQLMRRLAAGKPVKAVEPGSTEKTVDPAKPVVQPVDAATPATPAADR